MPSISLLCSFSLTILTCMLLLFYFLITKLTIINTIINTKSMKLNFMFILFAMRHTFDTINRTFYIENYEMKNDMYPYMSRGLLRITKVGQPFRCHPFVIKCVYGFLYLFICFSVIFTV